MSSNPPPPYYDFLGVGNSHSASNPPPPYYDFMGVGNSDSGSMPSNPPPPYYDFMGVGNSDSRSMPSNPPPPPPPKEDASREILNRIAKEFNTNPNIRERLR